MDMEQKELQRKMNELKRVTGLSFQIDLPAEDNAEDIVYAMDQLDALIESYKERNNRDAVYKKWITGDMSLSELTHTAKRFHVPFSSPRVLFLIEISDPVDEPVLAILKHSFPNTAKTWFVLISTHVLAMVETFSEHTSEEDLHSTAYLVMDILNTEALVQAKVAYSAVTEQLDLLPKAYKDACLALNVGKIFYNDQNIYPCNKLGFGCLLYGLTKEQCLTYVREVVGESSLSFFQPETIHVINCFLNNNLNIAETTRQLHMHRNTLIYRIEQIQKETGLDIRHFNDAMTIKTVLFVMNYINNYDEN
ncbi:MAG: helix-turn-helix domain-containing protein [Clostridiales bacterium]|nr:helix-turn-helix domain-containing protein [Clostridiales bacterium]